MPAGGLRPGRRALRESGGRRITLQACNRFRRFPPASKAAAPTEATGMIAPLWGWSIPVPLTNRGYPLRTSQYRLTAGSPLSTIEYAAQP